MEKDALEIGGFKFPWNVSATRGTEKHTHLDEVIRQCEQDSIAIQKENVYFSKIKTLFDENKNICIFVHSSQTNLHPDYCILCDIATPAEHGLLEETVLAISEKFVDSNFLEKRFLFLALLYSKENLMRLRKYGLKIYEICRYSY